MGKTIRIEIDNESAGTNICVTYNADDSTSWMTILEKCINAIQADGYSVNGEYTIDDIINGA